MRFGSARNTVRGIYVPLTTLAARRMHRQEPLGGTEQIPAITHFAR
jgi:hypothetical protein